MSQNSGLKPDFLTDPAPLSSDEQAYLRTLLSEEDLEKCYEGHCEAAHRKLWNYFQVIKLDIQIANILVSTIQIFILLSDIVYFVHYLDGGLINWPSDIQTRALSEYCIILLCRALLCTSGIQVICTVCWFWSPPQGLFIHKLCKVLLTYIC